MDLSFAPEIQVPADAWADWDAVNQRFITVGEKYPQGTTSLVKATVYYPADLWNTVTWHDGSPISLGDFVMYMIMNLDPGNPDLRRELAFLLAAMGRTAESEKELSAVPQPVTERRGALIEKSPQEIRELAEKSYRAGYLRDALEFYSTAHEQNPLDYGVVLQLGWTYNVLGQEVAVLADGDHTAGTYSVVWDAKNNTGMSVSTGVYIYRMTATAVSGRSFQTLRKMVLMK